MEEEEEEEVREVKKGGISALIQPQWKTEDAYNLREKEEEIRMVGDISALIQPLWKTEDAYYLPKKRRKRTGRKYKRAHPTTREDRGRL